MLRTSCVPRWICPNRSNANSALLVPADPDAASADPQVNLQFTWPVDGVCQGLRSRQGAPLGACSLASENLIRWHDRYRDRDLGDRGETAPHGPPFGSRPGRRPARRWTTNSTSSFAATRDGPPRGRRAPRGLPATHPGPRRAELATRARVPDPLGAGTRLATFDAGAGRVGPGAAARRGPPRPPAATRHGQPGLRPCGQAKPTAARAVRSSVRAVLEQPDLFAADVHGSSTAHASPSSNWNAQGHLTG